MQLDLIGNAKRNMKFGIISKIAIVLCPFVLRTFLQYILGEQYLGLGNLFTSILSVLKLSELGIGGAIVYQMYRPVAENDTEKVNSLLNFYRKAYALVGVAVTLIGLTLIPFLPHLIKGGYPQDINLTFLYLIYLFDTALSYFVFAYRQSLIIVYQRSDLEAKVKTGVTILMTVFQVLLLVGVRNYTVCIALMPVFTVANNLRIASITKKLFPQYHPEGKLTSAIIADMKKRVTGAVITRVGKVARNSLDSICISAFIGLEMTARYNNYYLILTAVITLLEIFVNSLTGGIGNHVVSDTKAENYKELKLIDFIFMWISGCCTVLILCLSQPFMKIWMKERMMLPDAVVILLSLYFYLLKMTSIRGIYTSVNGLWWEQRWRTITESCANVVLNILLARFFGIYGIIVATILTIFFINYIWGVRITFQYYFGLEYLKDYYLYHLKYGVVTVAVCVITWFVCGMIPFDNPFLLIAIRIPVCLLISNALYLLIYHRMEEYSRMKKVVFHIGKNENDQEK